MKALLSSTYFGPIQWYQKLNRYDEIRIEQYDSYMKQTYRNRCIIATTNGLQALTIPTERTDSQSSDNKMLMKDIRISDHGNWRHLHWNALVSAYGESPFFEYYADDIHPFFEKKWDFLFDFNMEIMEKMCELTDIRPNIQVTDEFFKVENDYSKVEGDCIKAEYDCIKTTDNLAYSLETIKDFREVIRPKHPLPDADFTPERYYQVYEQKHGFLPNLSILDLLFNMGNESIFLL